MRLQTYRAKRENVLESVLGNGRYWGETDKRSSNNRDQFRGEHPRKGNGIMMWGTGGIYIYSLEEGPPPGEVLDRHRVSASLTKFD